MKIAASLWSGWKAKRFRRPAGLLVVLGVLLCGACGGVPRTYYYTLETPSPPALVDPKTNFVLGVEHFRAPEVLRDDRILYYQSATQMNFYEHHRWGTDPATMLTEFTAQWADGLGVFSQVLPLPARVPVDYILRGRVLHCEEVDYPAGTKARVGLELTLVRTRDRSVVWSARNKVENPIQEKGMAGVASAINASTHQLLRQMLPGFLSQVEQENKAGPGRTP